MKVFIDTNVLISAALFPNSISAHALMKAISFPNTPYVCAQNLAELEEVFKRKFPEKLSILPIFENDFLKDTILVQVPSSKCKDEDLIRDDSDKTILRAAIAAKVDCILTGDKDFIESNVANPRIVSPSEFINPKFESVGR